MYTSRETRFWATVAAWAKVEEEIAEAEAAAKAEVDAAKADAYRKATKAEVTHSEERHYDC